MKNVHKLAGSLAVAVLLSSAPALASGLVLPATAPHLSHSHSGGRTVCAIPQMSLESSSPLIMNSSGGEATGYLPMEKNRWAMGATSDWNAGMNREVNHLINPPDHVKVLATQSDDDLQGHFEGTTSPNETLASFAVVIH